VALRRLPVLHVLEMAVGDGSTAIDHLAFAARDRHALTARLTAAAVPFSLTALPDGSALQLFVHDPDGARVELVFREAGDR
jgi:catechol 2,3-dioxygenase-like lactoylglutathione lyase family enzyme